jgi:uncharacterized membrane protein YqjE
MDNLARNGNGAGKLLDPVWDLLDTALAAAQNRLELFRVEAQEEKTRMVEVFLLASAILILGALALGMATFSMVYFFWWNGPEIAFSILILTYAAGAGVAWRLLKARLKSETLFASSAAELEKDRACINHRRV